LGIPGIEEGTMMRVSCWDWVRNKMNQKHGFGLGCIFEWLMLVPFSLLACFAVGFSFFAFSFLARSFSCLSIYHNLLPLFLPF